MDKLPVFPSTTALTEHNLIIIRDFARQLDAPYSDLNPLSLGAWNTNGRTAIARFQKSLVIATPHYRNGNLVYTILQPRPNNHTVLDLLLLLKDLGKKPMLKFVPESTVSAITPTILRVEEDRDNFDYICSTVELSRLEGAHYDRLRRYMRPLLREGFFELRQMELTPENHIYVQNLFDTWMINRNKAEHEVLAEKKAFTNAVKLMHLFDCRLYGLYHNDGLVGWSLYEIFNKSFAIGHFEKTDDSIPRMSYAFKVLVARDLINKCAYINYEQDLGIPGLRQSKNKLRPIRFLKKYNVKL